MIAYFSHYLFGSIGEVQDLSTAGLGHTKTVDRIWLFAALP